MIDQYSPTHSAEEDKGLLRATEGNYACLVFFFIIIILKSVLRDKF